MISLASFLFEGPVMLSGLREVIIEALDLGTDIGPWKDIAVRQMKDRVGPKVRVRVARM
jgi:hypothetical protein